MSIERIELAVEYTEDVDEGLAVVATVVTALGLDVNNDVDAILSSTDDGNPAVVAVLQPGINESDDNNNNNNNEEDAQ